MSETIKRTADNESDDDDQPSSKRTRMVAGADSVASVVQAGSEGAAEASTTGADAQPSAHGAKDAADTPKMPAFGLHAVDSSKAGSGSYFLKAAVRVGASSGGARKGFGAFASAANSASPAEGTPDAKAPPAFAFGKSMADRVTASDTKSSESKSSFLFGKSIAERAEKTEGETKEKDKESEKGTTETSKSSESLPIVVPVDEPKDVTLFETRSKLFEFYSENNSWKERGEGRVKLCRLIDTNAFRLVMHTTGTSRLILNIALFDNMAVERATQKSLRITALNHTTNSVTVYLLNSSVSDTTELLSKISAHIKVKEHDTDAINQRRQKQLEESMSVQSSSLPAQ